MQMNVIKFERFFFHFLDGSSVFQNVCVSVSLCESVFDITKGQLQIFNEFPHQSLKCNLKVVLLYIFPRLSKIISYPNKTSFVD